MHRGSCSEQGFETRRAAKARSVEGGDARAVKGAVDDFFSGDAAAGAPPDIVACPRQVVVTYRERGWNTWMVAK